MSSDPAGVSLMNPNRKGFKIVEANNWYSYVANNPVKYHDPSGQLAQAAAAALEVGIFIGIGVTVIHSYRYATDAGYRQQSDNFGWGLLRSLDRTINDLRNAVEPLLQSEEESSEEANDGEAGESAKPKEPKVIDDETDMADTETWPRPPVEGELEEGEPSRGKPRNRGEKSLYDETGREWRPHKPDKYHPEGHWDTKPPGNNTPWDDVPVN